MTDAPDPGRRNTADRRNAPRRKDPAAAPADRRDLVVAGSARPGKSDPGPEMKTAGSAAFAAQLLGQPGSKRGLKGGAPVLEGARSAYLETQFLGRDRRLPNGLIAKTKI